MYHALKKHLSNVKYIYKSKYVYVISEDIKTCDVLNYK